MTPPHVIGALADFGRSAGLDTLALGQRDSAAIRFDSGAVLRFEYYHDFLTVAMTVPCDDSAFTMRRMLAYSFPPPHSGGPVVRSGYISKSGTAIFAVRIPDSEVVLPTISAAFAALWEIVNEFGGPR